MKSSNFFVTKYRLIQKKYNKLKLRYIKGVENGNLAKSRMQELKLKLEKYQRQLNELGLMLGRAGKKGMLVGSLALGLTISACDDSDNADPFPNKIDLETLKLTTTTGANSPLNGIDIGSRSTPTFVDIDGDGDLDLFIGNSLGTFNYYKNTGSSTSATFTVQTGTNNPLNGIDVGSRSRISFGDIDGDGDLDFITGDSSGGIEYYKNTGSSTTPTFTQQTGSNSAFTGLEGVSGSSYNDYDLRPVLVDIDNDGDLDLFMATERYDYNNNTSSGIYTQQIRYYKNTGSKTAPAFTEQTGSSNPASSITVNYNTNIHFADLDRDGDLDLAVAYYSSPYILKIFENTGSSSSPTFVELTGANSPVSSISVPGDPAPTSADIDGDGDLDFFLGQNNGTISYFKNTTGE